MASSFDDWNALDDGIEEEIEDTVVNVFYMELVRQLILLYVGLSKKRCAAVLHRRF